MSARPLRIVHCFRSPTGGLFRHVRDLAEAQHHAGHMVGVVCDATIGGPLEESRLAALTPVLALGLNRVPMKREIAPSDMAATIRIMREIRALNPDVLHAHGAKGGVYARIAGTLLRVFGMRVARIYTPHGGSLHYSPTSLGGRVYFAAERLLGRMTDAFIFISQYEADTYAAKVGKPSRLAKIVYNGLRPEEFEPVSPAADASDFLYVGTFREIKGPDVFIEALALIREQRGTTPTATMIGDGDVQPYQAMAAERGLAATTRFLPATPIREAFTLGRSDGGAVAGRVTALHGPRDNRRAHAAGDDAGWRHPGNLHR